jgi:hypothetical protein
MPLTKELSERETLTSKNCTYVLINGEIYLRRVGRAKPHYYEDKKEVQKE